MDEVWGDDGGQEIDWGRTTADYALHRPGYPASFYERLLRLGIGLPGQRVLDLGTGTGNVARELARRGCRVTGVDVAEEQVEAARELAAGAGLEVDWLVARAEETGLPDGAFDVVTASQCWGYFDRDVMAAEIPRLLAAGGRLVTCHLSWLNHRDPIAARSVELVLAYNPGWTGARWKGDVERVPAWSVGAFDVAAWFAYDEPIRFTRESWRGRMRACRGIGASLPADRVQAFDEEHAALLESEVPEEFDVLHRIDAHVFVPHGALSA